MTTWLAVLVIAYLLLMLAIGAWARTQVHDTEDYLVAGRRLPLWMAMPTLLATWFGAGTLLTAADEVRAEGLRAAAMEPLGAGLCLILAGLVLAKPLWEMRLLTLADFFAQRYGRSAEVTAALLMIPTYLGWIGAQFVALAGLAEQLFGIPVPVGLALVAAIGTTYTLLGGMWSVTMTDIVQMTLVAIGLIILTLEVLWRAGGGVLPGLEAIYTALPDAKRIFIPRDSPQALLGWIGLLAVGTLGNLPGQDLMQRIFASRSSTTAVRACILAGLGYLTLGTLPLILGLAADMLSPGHAGTATIGMLAQLFLSPAHAILLLLAVISAVFSTIDSAILSPASVLSENVLADAAWLKLDPLARNRWAVLSIAIGGLVMAYWGEDAYSMLESAYALGLVSILAPLLLGVHTQRGTQATALWSMGLGTIVWLVHMLVGWETFLGPWTPLPTALCCGVLSTLPFVWAKLPPSA